MGTMAASTGLSYGGRPEAEHAARAVTRALKRARLSRANGVLLFLTPHYAINPDPAIRAAARAAGCLQVIGATAAGILTEQEWVLDSPGAAAMVFAEPITLALPGSDTANDEAVLLSLSAPAGLTADWLDVPARRIGAISGDLFGHGPFKVWASGRVAESGRADVRLLGARGAIGASQGVRALTSPIEVAEVHGYDVKRLGNYPALNVLVKSLPDGIREMERIPLHLIMGGVTFGDPLTAIREGRYRLNHIVSANPRDQSITLSQALARGERLFWAMRDALTAERDMRHTIDIAANSLRTTPSFALLFPCMGRGPHFYGNRDRDLDALTARFPRLPVIGMYGNGEIGPLDDANHLYQYSTVIGLFHAQAT
ncbi:MAG: FIST C-terminal domain-containing protein [Sulfurifustaceae bacterium]